MFFVVFWIGLIIMIINRKFYSFYNRRRTNCIKKNIVFGFDIFVGCFTCVFILFHFILLCFVCLVIWTCNWNNFDNFLLPHCFNRIVICLHLLSCQFDNDSIILICSNCVSIIVSWHNGSICHHWDWIYFINIHSVTSLTDEINRLWNK